MPSRPMRGQAQQPKPTPRPRPRGRGIPLREPTEVDAIVHGLPGPDPTGTSRPQASQRKAARLAGVSKGTVQNVDKIVHPKPDPTPAPATTSNGTQPQGDMLDEKFDAEAIDRYTRYHEYPEPEDRGKAHLSAVGGIEYVDDLIRPGRILTWAAEEGTGKSFTVNGELAIRVALAGGSLAGTWPVNESPATVLVLSEMHPDDEYEREERILAALGRSREELTGGLYRLPLMTAAKGKPALTDPQWRRFITLWCRKAHVKLLIFDTATGATQIEPWGRAIQEVFLNLRLMLEEAPDLAIVLVVHLKKPNAGRGKRTIADVIGEWQRWADVVMLMEADGPTRVKLTSRKRVRQERMVVVTKKEGLLVDPVDLTDSGPKVPIEQVIVAIASEPGITNKGLATKLDVSAKTAERYAKVAEASGRVRHDKGGPNGSLRWYVDEATEQLRLAAEAEE